MCNDSATNKEQLMKRIGEKWKAFLTSGAWTIHSDPFWTYPQDYRFDKNLEIYIP